MSKTQSLGQNLGNKLVQPTVQCSMVSPHDHSTRCTDTHEGYKQIPCSEFLLGIKKAAIQGKTCLHDAYTLLRKTDVCKLTDSMVIWNLLWWELEKNSTEYCGTETDTCIQRPARKEKRLLGENTMSPNKWVGLVRDVSCMSQRELKAETRNKANRPILRSVCRWEEGVCEVEHGARWAGGSGLLITKGELSPRLLSGAT